MKTLLLGTLCLIASSTALTAREFTDPQGRKLEAEIVSVTGGQAVLKRAADGRAITVNIATFSEADQKFLKEFGEANMKYSFDVSYTKKKLSEAKSKDGPVEIKDETWIYKILIKNRLPMALADLRVDYWCFRREDTGKGRGGARIETSGSTTLAALTGSGSVTVDSSEIVLHKEKLTGNYYYPSGTNEVQADATGGLAVRIFDKNGKEVHKWATKDDLLAAAVGKPMSGSSSADKKK